MRAGSGMKKIRCAIYTRKSSEDGLEQEFNSLHAQREACASYIASQKHEGWVLLPDAYDDGGLSGGSLERPALQQLLQDVGGGQGGSDRRLQDRPPDPLAGGLLEDRRHPGCRRSLVRFCHPVFQYGNKYGAAYAQYAAVICTIRT